MTKPAELREQTDEQLELLLKETQQNLFRLRLQSETERLEAPSEIVKAKREIARIKTILRLREIEREPAAAGHGRLTRDDRRRVRAEPTTRPTKDRDEPTDAHHARAPPARRRKTEIGVVTSDKMNKTRRVEIETLVPAPEVRQDASGGGPSATPTTRPTQSHVGDMVEIMETRPLSKLKRWRIVRIVRAGRPAGPGRRGRGRRAGPGRVRARRLPGAARPQPLLDATVERCPARLDESGIHAR